jgi:hypothetical protein
MKQRIRAILGLAFAAMAALVIAAPAHAAFTLSVQDDGAAAIPIADNSPLDTNPTVGVIDVNTSALNVLLTHFTFVNLGAGSNSTIGTPGSDDQATLGATGFVSRNAGSASATLTIVTTDTGYLFPDGNPKTMTTSASDTFRNSPPGTSRTFQSLFNGTILSPLLSFTSPVGVGPFSTSNPGVDTPLGTQPTPFDLSNTTVLTLGPNPSSTSISSDQFTGATTITGATAIPEPSTLALMLLGIPVLAVARRRLRTV